MLREPFRGVGCRAGVKAAVVVFALVALAAPLGASGEQAAPVKVAGTVLAIESSRGQDYLVRLDANSLRPLSKRLALGGHAHAWSFSPDGRRLALGVDRVRGVRIVDVPRMKFVGRIQTWGGGIAALAWVAPRRILGWEGAGLFLLDPVARKRLPSPKSPGGDVLLAQRAGNRLVLLAAGSFEIGPARLAVVEADGAVRSVQLDRIRAGMSPPLETRRGESYRPALVLDPAGRAYVVGAAGNEPVAEVDLATLTVTYHDLDREQSLLTRLRNWLEPAAEAKEPLVGSSRAGVWLGDGKLAVWGYDSVPVGERAVETRPAGLAVIDTSAWTKQMIDPNVWHAAFAGGTLLASYQRGGLTGFTPAGDRRYHVFDGDKLGVVATFDTRAFVAFDRRPVHVLDAATGRVLGTRRGVPRLLHPSFSGW
jgi:hypothetical protein